MPLKDSSKNLLTRREACAVLGIIGAGTLGLVGCGSGGSDSTSRTGYASDTEVKSYPVHLKVYADSYIQWHLNTLGKGGQIHLEDHIERYRQKKDRSDVSFEVVYASSAELLAMAREGFPDGDGLLALRDTVEEGCASGMVDGGIANLSVRRLSYHYSDSVCLVRVLGGDAGLPPATTLTGEDGGGFNRLQQLPWFDGTVALADPDSTLEGVLANKALAHEEFYSERMGFGGSYSEDVAAKIVVYPSQDAAMVAVAAGECRLGFALQTALATRYPEVEEVYMPSHGWSGYDGAALSCSTEPGVMRDFFEFEVRAYD
jgi:hypothetical protein